MNEGAVRILAVCTANISRSPAVERLLRAKLGDTVRADSAGVSALVGAPIDPPVAEFLREHGAETAGFAARQVDEAMLKGSDLVLTLSRAHRSQVLELAPSAVRRTFTLLELARVLESLDLDGLPAELSAGDRLRAVLPLATAGRALAQRAQAGDDDVPDPYGRGALAYVRSLALIAEATDAIVRTATVAPKEKQA